MQSGSEANLWKQIALFLITLGILIVVSLILKPFLPAIVGAIVIAVITGHPYQWLARKVTSPNLRATTALFLIILSIIVPTFFLTESVGEQIANVVATLRSETTQQQITDFFGHHPLLASRILTISNSIDLPQTTRSAAAYFGSKLAVFIGGSISVITQIVVMLFILFFLYRDRALAESFARSLLPLEEDECTLLLERLHGTINATALGRLAIAAVQGTLAGLAYWTLGVPNAFLWGMLTGVMAMIPAFGAFLVWVPIGLFLGFSGHWGKAALLAIWGGAIVSTIDNLLYPMMVGSQLRQHSVAVLLSILGGIALFGITGIILGPLTFTTMTTLLEIWKARAAQPQGQGIVDAA
jgi:predicted PurR-regulated permease PerM